MAKKQEQNQELVSLTWVGESDSRTFSAEDIDMIGVGDLTFTKLQPTDVQADVAVAILAHNGGQFIIDAPSTYQPESLDFDSLADQ